MKSLSPGGGLWDGNPDTQKKKSDENGEEEVKESIDITDFIEALFEGQNLSEEFKQKATVIFETALNQKVQMIENAMIEASKEIIAEQVTESITVLTEKVDDYLNVVVKEWLVENKLQVEQGFRTEIAENFINGMKELFENSYVQVPEDKIDLVDELFAENKKLEESVNELIKQKMELEQSNLVNECATAFIEMSSGLTDTEVEKLANLSEGIEFNDLESYKNKLSVIKESYFNNNNNSNNSNHGHILTEDTSISGNQSFKNTPKAEMAVYVNALSKHLKQTNRKV
jgi:phenylpyruvate tautomerase PptA (4-oxalocrotonate tautomerase family)